MSDENESYFMIIIKIIFKIIIYPFILLYKLFKLSLQNPRIIAVVLGIVAIFGTIYYFYINEEDEVKTSQEDDDSETPPGSDDSEETEGSDSGETEGSGWSRLTAAVAGVSTTENATCLSVTECPPGYIKKTGSDSVQCSSTECEVSLGGTDLNTCCEPWTCAISGDDLALYDIQVRGSSISENTISYTDIGGATVSCKGSAQMTGADTAPSIGGCINNGDNVILNGCDPRPAVVNCEGTWSEWDTCTSTCGGGTQNRTYSITTQKVGSGQDCQASSGDVETRECNTGDCDTCSNYNCQNNYIPRSSPDGISCEKPDCSVGGDDVRDICCEQGCSAPDTMPTGYAGSLPAALTVGNNAEITESTVQCASNYHLSDSGIQYTCSAAGGVYSLSGCDPDECITPDTTGYNITGETNLPNFSVDVTCAPGYGSSTAATAQAVACESDRGTYSLTGCENKTGFCSGNTSVPDVTCGDGYTLKSDSDRIVDRNTASCCDPWTCAISVSDRALYNIQVGSNSISGNTISYTDIGGATVSCKASAQRTSGSTEPSIQRCVNNNGNVTLNGCEHAPVDCVVDWSEWSDCSAECGEGTQTRTYTVTTQHAHGGSPCPTTPESQPCNTEACATCSSYQCPTDYNDKPNKNTIVGNTLDTCCDQIITPEAQASESQGTELPICEDIKLADQVASVARDEIIENITLEECMTHCRDNDNCNSFSYKAAPSNCYIYYQSNLEHHRDAHYDYYLEKCQP